MKKLSLYIILSFLLLNNQAFSQNDTSKVSIIFIKDFSARDYYTLQNTDKKTLLFTIEEACIPKGFIAIKYDNDYDVTQKMNYTQTVILKLIDKNATYTAYTLKDLRNFCAQYRKEVVNE